MDLYSELQKLNKKWMQHNLCIYYSAAARKFIVIDLSQHKAECFENIENAIDYMSALIF